MPKDYYLKISRASDLKNPKERALFRFLEMLPGLLSFGTLFFAVILSWLAPVYIAFFIIFFVIFWFFRLIYFSFHLAAGYRRMRQAEKKDWLEALAQLDRYSLPIKSWKEIYHLIVLPMYKEPFEVVRDSLKSLSGSDYPKDKMIVVLAGEERVKNETAETAKKIEKEFGNKFFRFLVTWHPLDLEHEIAGKGSNETWAIKQAKKETIDRLKIPYKNIIVSPFDVDTVVFPKYFSCLTWHYLSAKKPMRTSFQPIPIYTNNVWKVPAISRVFSFSSGFWQIMNQERPEKLITFSSHSMSFNALADVGFKNTRVVSDDSRIFWQCFLKYDGDYRVEPLFYPVSMDANVAKSFWRTMMNIYKQQRRWAYGAGDIAYFLFGFLKNKKIPLSKKLSLGLEMLEGHWAWATAPLMIFFLGWLPLILGGPKFSQTMISYNLPRAVSWVSTASNIGIISSAYFSMLILPPKPPQYGRFKTLFLVAEWFLIPLVMIFFSALPALDAQAHWLLGRYLGFWPTEKVRK